MFSKNNKKEVAALSHQLLSNMLGYLSCKCVRLWLSCSCLLRPASLSHPPCWVRLQAVPWQRPAASASFGHTRCWEVRVCGTAAVEWQEADQVTLICDVTQALCITCSHTFFLLNSNSALMRLISSLMDTGIGVEAGSHGASWLWRSWVHLCGSCITSPAVSLRHPCWR